MLSSVNIFPPGPNRLFLAPMAGITDISFRTLMRRMGADVVISELVSSEGLVRGGTKTLELMAFCDEERPVGIQLFGSNTESMVRAAQMVEARGADFVDVNFGCPVKKVVCDGAGAAWLKDPAAMGKLLTEMKRAIRIPLTIKVRLGWDDQSINIDSIAKVAGDAGVSWMAIHGRTRAQGYSGQANWEVIQRVAKESPIPIIGNGDLISADQIRQKLEEGFSHGVMVGRGALKNPWIFLEAKGLPFIGSFKELVTAHIELAVAHKGETRAFLSLKKFLSWYASGYPNCSLFRERIFKTRDIGTLRSISLDYFETLAGTRREICQKPFLMGGHG